MSSLPEATRDELFSDRIRWAIEGVQERQSRLDSDIATFRFGPLILGIRIQPGRLTCLPEMLAHRKVSDLPATALIDVTDGPEPDLEALLPSQYYGTDRFVMSSPTAYCLWEPDGGGKLTAIDRTNGRGVVWYRSAPRLPSWEVARPFLQAFKGLSPTTGLMPVHAAAVAFGELGILITGHSGVGKTSMALACVEAGWRYIGDDVVLISSGPLRAINLYRSARVREDMIPHLQRSMAGMVTVSTDSGELKAELDVGRLPSSAVGDADIGAILVPCRMGAPGVSIATMRRSTVLRELSANTLVALPGDAASSYDVMAQAMGDTPCYSIDPGPVLALVPAALQRLAAAR